MTSCIPRSVEDGIPVRRPWSSIDSHSGPFKRLNLRSLRSLSESKTSSDREAVNNSPTTASPSDHCAAIQDGRWFVRPSGFGAMGYKLTTLNPVLRLSAWRNSSFAFPDVPVAEAVKKESLLAEYQPPRILVRLLSGSSSASIHSCKLPAWS